jgi:hypothetical protein
MKFLSIKMSPVFISAGGQDIKVYPCCNNYDIFILNKERIANMGLL